MAEVKSYSAPFNKYLEDTQNITWETNWPERMENLVPHAESLLRSLPDKDLIELLHHLEDAYKAGSGKWNEESEKWAWNIWQLYNAHISAEALRVNSRGLIRRKFPFDPTES